MRNPHLPAPMNLAAGSMSDLGAEVESSWEAWVRINQDLCIHRRRICHHHDCDTMIVMDMMIIAFFVAFTSSHVDDCHCL